jgi:hypothetical protein
LADYVKTEDEQQMFDEMLAYQEKVSRLRITLDARRRARGDAVEVSGQHKTYRIPSGQMTFSL